MGAVDWARAQVQARTAARRIRGSSTQTSTFDEDDLVQEAMARLLKLRVREEAGKATFVALHIKGAMLDYLRATSWVPRSVQARGDYGVRVGPLEDGDVGPARADAGLVGLEAADAFEGLIAPLPTRWREVFRLRFVAGLTLAEAAAVLGLSESGVLYVERCGLAELRGRLNPPAQSGQNGGRHGPAE